MKSKKEAIIGIVTFNPEIERLKENIGALLEQTSEIVIVDNGSNNYKDIYEMLDSNIAVLRNEKNEGIASALCKIMEYARDNGYSWVLSLDQDSVIQPGLMERYYYYSKLAENSDVAMFTCLIKDRNFTDEKYEEQSLEIIDVPYCITSAAYTNVEKYFMTNGYDRDFFIDAVDFDICYTLREAGYRVCRISYVGLYHEVGHGENRSFFGKNIVVYHQKPFRVYYLARNTITMSKKHRKLFPWFVMIKKEAALLARILFYEDCKYKKLIAFYRGVMRLPL